MRPVLLGMNNPISDDPRHALYPHPPSCTGARLQRFSGLDKRTYLEVFDRRNVIGGQAWDAKLARSRAPALREELLGRHVVLLGAPVNSVMRGGTKYELARAFRWTPDGSGGWLALVPHPSGLNHFYNDKLNQELLAIFLQELVEYAKNHEDAVVRPMQTTLL